MKFSESAKKAILFSINKIRKFEKREDRPTEDENTAIVDEDERFYYMESTKNGYLCRFTIEKKNPLREIS